MFNLARLCFAANSSVKIINYSLSLHLIVQCNRSQNHSGHPGRIENGKMTSYVFTFKSKVYFECNQRYELHGNKFRQCQSNQQWSGRVPKCKRTYRS